VTADVFAEWLRRQGIDVVRTPSTYWHRQGPRVYQAFPYHALITPTADELQSFLRDRGALGLRYSTALEADTGCLSYHAVCEDKTYGLESLSAWARKNVRRGGREASVAPMAFESLAADGWALQRDTLDRQARQVPLREEAWRTRCLAARDLPGFQAWGATVGDRLAASVITCEIDGWGYMLSQQCHRDFLASHVNNALAFTVTCALLARPGVRAILYGLHSLDAPPSVDEFKFRMGYTAKAVRQRVVFRRGARSLVNPMTHLLLRGARRLAPRNATLAKAEGMVRFYRQGLRPLQHQPVPPGLDRVTERPPSTAVTR
jgi:hypothetical protein